MKTILTILFILVTFSYASNEGILMIRLKDKNFEPQLELFKQVKSSQILSFQPLIAEELKDIKEKPTETLKRLSLYYEVITREKSTSLLSLQKEILETQQEIIDACYILPKSELPVIEVYQQIQEKSNTPLYVNRQFYLENPPRGVGQSYSITKPGGTGKNVQVVDIEGGWDLGHEDLAKNPPKLIFGAQAQDQGWTNHGSAVLGEIGGNQNNFGVTGIAPETNLFVSSIYRTPTSQGPASAAFLAAARFLNPGDIMLIELHAIGPNGGFIPMEWWPDNFDALKFATEKGIIVIEAGGNGNQNLDLPIYNRPQAGFPPNWKNPFNRSLADSGCVLVGAGAPPSLAYGPLHSRLSFSNYGNSLDVQAYGYEVCTLGYGDLQAINRNRYYTNRFSGTSSASPIVVGVVTALQGISKAMGRTLRPADVRRLLRETGSPQTDHPQRPRTERIGNFPNLNQLINRLGKM